MPSAAQTSEAALEMTRVAAGYGRRRVLNGLDLTLGAGLHVLLGSNGAGKTTLFRVGAGVLPPAAGTLRLFGVDPAAEPEIKRRIGYLTHRAGLYPSLSVADNLAFWARAEGVAPADLRRRIDELTPVLQLGELLPAAAGALSRGQLQRAAIARALLTDPQLLFLDEVTTGLDPGAARSLRTMLRGLAQSERCLIFSTHNLYEADELADDVLVLAGGRITARGSVAELQARFAAGRRLGLRLEGEAEPVLRKLGYTPRREGERWVIELGARDRPAHIVAALVQAGILVDEVREQENPLESIYLGLEGERRD